MTKAKAPEQEPKRRGRPPKDNPLVSISVRLDPAVIAYFQDTAETTIGAAINAVLCNYVKRKARG